MKRLFEICGGKTVGLGASRGRSARRLAGSICALALSVSALIASGCRAPEPTAGPKSPRTHEVSVRPGINDEYKDPDVDVWIGRFEREGREIYANREQIVDLIDAKPGSAVADIGAGTGVLTTLLAEKAGPAGRVYAVDIVPKFLRLIRSRADEAGLTNIETVLCTEDSVELPPNSIDLAILCDVYHHLEYPESTLGTIYHALRPGGQVIVIDFIRIPGESREWVLHHVRAGEQTVLKELKAAGFELSDTNTKCAFLKENYFLRLHKVS